jgi:hypothetical protein
MTVYLAWAPDLPPLTELAGPWTELKLAAPGVLLVESDDTLSRVFHELKWALPSDAPLLVVPVESRPKLRHLADGTLTWLRERISRK